MADRVLVAYATRYGSTQEVAEEVATVLRKTGCLVDDLSMREVRSLDDYCAVVLGIPLYMGQFLKDARRFLARQKGTLASLPVALFVLGPTTAGEKDRADVQENLDARLAELTWFRPASQALFGGKWDPAVLRFPWSLLVSVPASPLHGQPATDARDWDAIRAWAETLPEVLGLAV